MPQSFGRPAPISTGSPLGVARVSWMRAREKEVDVTAGLAVTSTIAIPVYNGERYLVEAIDSAIDQTVAPTELLVFDNASTDATARLAEQRLGPGSVRAAPRNRGAAWNFSRAVRESSGVYFAWLAADDRLDSRFLERTVAALDASPSRAACLSGVEFIDLAGRPIGVQRDEALADSRAGVRLRAFLRRNRWTEVYCLYRRDALLRSPMFRGVFADDVILTWWFLLRGPFVVLDEPLLQYRVDPTRTNEDMAQSLGPGMPNVHWRKLRMWRALWRETAVVDVDAQTRRAARRELLLALGSRTWLEHNAMDLRHALSDAPRRIRKRAQVS